MQMDAVQIRLRALLSPEGARHFDDIVLLRKLGTVNNISAIGHIYADLAAHAAENGLASSKELIDRVDMFTQYFSDTRGKHSCSIVTAMRIMTKGLAAYGDKPIGETVAFLEAAYPAYETLSSAWTARIKTYLANLSEGLHRVLLFDYSSTVSCLLEAAAERGRQLEVYIPCSGMFYGGRQFVVDAVRHGHKPFVMPDVGMMEFLQRADGAFIGAESLYADGGVSNSIGSDIVAALCKVCGTPLYVVSTMLKFNGASLEGQPKKYGDWDLRDRLDIPLPQEVRDAADFRSRNLTQVDASCITAIITELGVIPPSAMYHIGREYLQTWKEPQHE